MLRTYNENKNALIGLKKAYDQINTVDGCYTEAIAKDNYYLSLVEQKFMRQVKDFSWFKFLRSAFINKLKAANSLFKIVKTYLRYGIHGTMPLKYQLRFVRYHLLMAFSWKKFRTMLVKKSAKHKITKT